MPCLLPLVALATPLAQAQSAAPKLPDAVASDPVTLGWMVGSPPPADSGGALRRRLGLPLPADALELLELPPAGADQGRAARIPRRQRTAARRARRPRCGELHAAGRRQPMSWAQSLAANYTDGIVVLHKGRIVYERYFGCSSRDAAHRDVGHQILLRHHRRDADRRGQARRERARRPARARTRGHRLRRRHGAPAARHEHRPQVQRELRRPERRDLGPRARRQRAAAPARLPGAGHLLRVPADGAEGRRARPGLRLQDGQHRRAGLGDPPRHRASRSARTWPSASGTASAPSRTPTSPSTPSATSSPAAA